MHSATMKGFDPIIPYFISLLEMTLLFKREYRFSLNLGHKVKEEMTKKHQDMSNDLISFLLMFPSNFGGFPIMCPLELIYRGHPDPLMSELVWLKYLASQGVAVAKLIMIWITTRVGIHSDRNYKMLIQDPLSINWKRPQQAANIMKETLEVALSSKAINKDIRTLLRTYNKKSYDDLVSYLMTIQPCIPRVHNEILRNSPEGAKLNFLSTFIDMRTMKGILSYEDASSMLYALKEADLNQLLYSISLFKSINGGSFLNILKISTVDLTLNHKVKLDWHCTSSLADNLRAESWGVPIIGSTTPHPLEQFKISCNKTGNCRMCPGYEEYISFILLNPKESTELNDNPVFLRGYQTPYWGSGTVEKKTNPFIKISGTDRALDAAKRLSRVKMWVMDSNSKISEFIENLIQSRTEIDSKLLELVSGVYFGGSVTHRFADVMSKHVSRPNIRGNIFTNIFMSSDHMGLYSKGLENYTMHYQGAFLLGLTMISIREFFCKKLSLRPQAFHLHVNCRSCCKALIEPKMYSDHPYPNVRMDKTCKILYSSIKSIGDRIDLSSMSNIPMDSPNIKDPLLKTKSLLAMAYIILGCVMRDSSPLILDKGTTDTTLHHSSSITLGSVITLGVSDILKYFTMIWFLDNLSRIITKISVKIDTLKIKSKSYLMDNLPSLNYLLGSIISHPEVRASIFHHVDDYPVSSEAFLSLSGMDKVIYHIMSKWLDYWIDNIEGIEVNLFINAEGINIVKLINHWISWVSLQQYNSSDLKNSLRMMTSLRKIMYKCVQDGRITLGGFFLHMNNIYHILHKKSTNTYLGENIWMIKNYDSLQSPFNLSQVGADPWIRCYMDAKKEKMRILPIITSVKPRRLPNQSLISMIKELNYQQEINFDTLKTEDSHMTETITEWPDRERYKKDTLSRSDHQHRLTGKYSTAHYKYLQIISKELSCPITGSVNLAEGAGGVAAMTHRVFGNSFIVYNSLINMNTACPHRAISFVPAELEIIKEQIELHGVSESINTGGDLLKINVINQLIQIIKKKRNIINLVTCDAEISGGMDLESSDQLTDHMCLLLQEVNSGTLFIMKTFCHSSLTVARQICKLSRLTDTVKVIVPLHSTNEGFEIFLSVIINNQTYGAIRRIDLSTELLETLDNLTDSRFHEYPHAKTIPHHIELRIHNLLLDCGYYTNLWSSIESLTNHVIYRDVIKKDLYRSLGDIDEICHTTLIKRLIIQGRIKDSKMINYSDRLNLKHKASDVRELNKMGKVLFNTSLIRKAIKRDVSVFSECLQYFNIYHNKRIVFIYKPVFDDWMSVYARH